MRAIVVGGGGQLGTAVVRELRAAGAHVTSLAHSDLDVTDYQHVAALADLDPDALINCSAFNDVDAAERDVETAMAINSTAVRALALTAERAGAAFVHYSSDFVFDGRADAPYDEAAAVNPINQYGRSKAIGEWWAERPARHYILRLSSVFGGRPGEGLGGRSSIDRIIDQMRAGIEVRAFQDRTVTPSYAPDVARVTRLLLERNLPAGTYHCVSSEPTTWAELAAAVAEMVGFRCRITPVPMSEVTLATPRPLRCALADTRLVEGGIPIPPWRDALYRHLDARGVLRRAAS